MPLLWICAAFTSDFALGCGSRDGSEGMLRARSMVAFLVPDTGGMETVLAALWELEESTGTSSTRHCQQEGVSTSIGHDMPVAFGLYISSMPLQSTFLCLAVFSEQCFWPHPISRILSLISLRLLLGPGAHSCPM